MTNVNSPHDHDSYEELEGNGLLTVNPSQKPPRRRDTLTVTTHTHDTAKDAFVCIEFEDMRGEKYESENDIDTVVQLLRYCIHKPCPNQDWSSSENIQPKRRTRVKDRNQRLHETQKEVLTGQTAKVPPTDNILKGEEDEDPRYIVERCHEHIHSRCFV